MGTPISPENAPQSGVEGQATAPGALLSNPEAMSLAPPNQTLPNPAAAFVEMGIRSAQRETGGLVVPDNPL